METHNLKNHQPEINWADDLRKELKESSLFIEYGIYGDSMMQARIIRSKNAIKNSKEKKKKGYFESEDFKKKASFAGKKGIKKTLEKQKSEEYFQSEEFKEHLKRFQKEGCEASIQKRKDTGWYQSEEGFKLSQSGGLKGGKVTAEKRKAEAKITKKKIYDLLPNEFRWIDYLDLTRKMNFDCNHKHLSDKEFFEKIGRGKWKKVTS